MRLQRWLWKCLNALTTQIARFKQWRESMQYGNNFLLAITFWLFRINFSSQKVIKVLGRVQLSIQILLGRSILCNKWRCVKEAYTIQFRIIQRIIRILLLTVLRNCLRFKCLMLWTCCIKSTSPMEISPHNTS